MLRLRLALTRGAPHPPRSPRPPHRRSLHISTHTIQHPTPAVVSALLPAGCTVFFSLSTSLPAASLSALVAALGPRNVGGFHVSDVPTLALAVIAPEADVGTEVSTFHDPTQGRAPVQVGKWQRLGTSWTDDTAGSEVGALEKMLGGEGWEGVWRGEERVGGVQLDARTRAVLCFTDGTPQTLLSALAGQNVSTLGLVSSPTPFLTGRPHTLFHNGTAYSTGSVGVALSAAPAKAEVVYGIEGLDREFVVESARGNLLLTMQGAPNPTQALIGALQRRDAGKPRDGLTKDEDFWLSIRDGNASPRIVRILSGDPARGALSVETDATLAPGQVVQFMHRPTAPPPLLPLSSALRFGTLARAEGYTEPIALSDETRIMPGFLAASEDGFIYGAQGDAVVCSVAGASVTARWWS